MQEKATQASEIPLSRDEIRQHERLSALLEEHGATWDSPLDPRDPYNWSGWRKFSITLIYSLGQLITLMSASMMAAALPKIGTDLHLGSSATQITFQSTSSALPLRRSLSQPSLRFGPSAGLMTVGRFLAGSGASAGITLTGPVLADMYPPEERGRSIALATFIPYIGPALGPIVGGITSQHLPWKWLFWILSIFDAAVVLAGYFFLRETYTPVLLERRAAQVRRNVAAPETRSATHSPRCRAFFLDLRMRLGVGILRPLSLLVYRPAIQVIAAITALNFAVYCLLLSTYATLWIDRYHESETISSLNYIALAVGTVTASQAGGPLMDWIYARMKARNGDEAVPEFRVPFMIPGVIMMPVGIFLYGWAAEKKLHWMVVDVGTAIFVCGSFVLGQGMLAYMLDEFEHAASANAASRMLSNIFGFVFPIFAPAMYQSLGYGWGNTLLGFIWVVCGFPIPILLWVYGPRLRALGRKQ